MTLPTGRPEVPFDADEVGEEGEQLVPVARQLEAYASDHALTPPADLVERIVVATEGQAPPTPARSAWRALLADDLPAAWRGFQASIRMALRGGADVPRALRLEAVGLILGAVLLAGLTIGGAAVGAGMVVHLLNSTPGPTHISSPAIPPTSSPTVEPSPEPTTSPTPSSTPTPSPTATEGSSGGSNPVESPTRTPGERTSPPRTPAPSGSEDGGDGGGYSSGTSGSPSPAPSFGGDG